MQEVEADINHSAYTEFRALKTANPHAFRDVLDVGALSSIDDLPAAPTTRFWSHTRLLKDSRATDAVMTLIAVGLVFVLFTSQLMKLLLDLSSVLSHALANLTG
jgi:hypothetical protein